MNDKIHSILQQIKQLERDLIEETRQKEREFRYEIQHKKIHFKEEIVQHHQAQAKKLKDFFKDAQWSSILTAPVIWLCVVPAAVMDIVVTIYQWICFSAYRIPKVKRHDYIVIDRHFLAYLNIIEKINCLYCSYFNGVIAYTQEIAARTEQYWCPIKHAIKTKTIHSRYPRFFNYGDSTNYRENLKEARKDFSDINNPN